MKIVVSNGSNKFHLAPLAAELASKGMLSALLAAGWPTRHLRRLALWFARIPNVQRFLDRREEIPEHLVHAFNEVEIVFQIGIVLRRISPWHEQTFDRLGFAWYGQRARKVVRDVRPDIYHYRACYGLSSVPVAKEIGAVAICDQSIGHPAVLNYMVENQGRWPTVLAEVNRSPLESLMEKDIAQADEVLVNSDFVKETFVFAGIPPERVHVVYWGVDDKFLRCVPDFDAAQVQARAGHPLLYAGVVERRKGVAILAEALDALGPAYELQMIGGFEPGIEKNTTLARLLAGGQIKRLGIAPRAELSAHMTRSPIFVFPSFCEGSARVIFEAMACGCFVITTPNTGSIVEDGKHGILVTPGDASALAKAITWAVEHPQEVAEIGWRNSRLVRAEYRQSQYGDRICEVYRSVLSPAQRR